VGSERAVRIFEYLDYRAYLRDQGQGANMKHFIGLGALLVALVSCASSGGTETDNPDSVVEDFASSSCKNKAPGDGQQALILASDAEGLQCVEWEEKASGGLRLRLLNFPEACGKLYLGRAERAADGALEVSVYKDTCDVYRCGNCVYDFDFDLTVSVDAPLGVRLGSAVCASQPTTFDEELTLPLDEEPSGIRCRPLHPHVLQQYASARGSCGELNMPCGDCSAGQTACAAGSACVALASGDSRCLADCTTDSDCVAGLTSCQEGACRAAESW
jgi:hypothetical protein